ncbi:glucokinase [biofilm metagenome]
MILAGDIGGTKTVLALYSKKSDGLLCCEREETFVSGDFAEFNDILALFFTQKNTVQSACFGVAGPVVNQRCHTTNLPWILDAEALKKKLVIDKVRLLNDLEAMALGMLHLPETDLIELNPKAQARRAGNKAVIAAGTGLGEAILYQEGTHYHPIATEGGHCDFAPQNNLQDKLLIYLRNIFPDHVSWERILSGDGFSHLYDFLLSQDIAPACPEVPPLTSDGVDRNAVISKLGLAGTDPLCGQALQLFVELYGAEAGNLALKALATGGVFVGGGIAPKILPAMQDGRFINAFSRKGRFQGLMDNISVKLSLNPRTPLIGALNAAIQLGSNVIIDN